MIMQAFIVFADRLVEIMSGGILVALIVRYVAYRSSLRDQIYFRTFSRGVEKILEGEDKRQKVEDIDHWLGELLGKVKAFLPDRSIRHSTPSAAPPGAAPAAASFRFKERETLTEFAEGKKSIIHAIKQQADAMKSPTAPNFYELTQRVLDQDRQWKRVIGLPFDMLSRVLDILPGLFVVGGIFGTFIGIASGLPKIGAIDLSKIQESAPILTAFIDSVALSMRCSIAGILCSVVMTILNALYPLTASRQDVQRELERCLELMWYRIHGNKLSYADQRMIQVLENIEMLLRAVPMVGEQTREIRVRDVS